MSYELEAKTYEVAIAAPVEVVWRALHEMDTAESLVLRTLFRLRGLKPSYRLRDLADVGFVTLAEDPPTRLELGLIGRPWTIRGGIVRVPPEEFEAFTEPGYAKIRWQFRARESRPGSTILSTTTRISCTDALAERRFSRYWRFVEPMSGWTRREMLRLIKAKAEES